MRNKMISAVVLCGLPLAASAHPGHSLESFSAAFAHPFSGLDHLLAMLCVGVWAGFIGGAARWQLPLAFLGSMLCGWLFGMSGIVIPGIESGIAATVIALGIVLAAQKSLPRSAQVALVAGFALLQGIAHGVELSTAAPWQTTLGFLSATALLHLSGVGLALAIPRHRIGIYRVLGAFLAIIGGGLLAAA